MDVWRWCDTWTDEPIAADPPDVHSPSHLEARSSSRLLPISAPPSVVAPSQTMAVDLEVDTDHAANELICMRARAAIEKGEICDAALMQVIRSGGRAVLARLKSTLLSNEAWLASFAEQYLQLSAPPEVQSFHTALLFIEEIVCARVAGLQSMAGRLLLGLLLTIAKRLPRQMADGLFIPLLQHDVPSLVQVEVLVRIATDALPAPLLASVLITALTASATWTEEHATQATTKLLTLVPAPAPPALVDVLLTKAEQCSKSMHNSHVLAHLLLLLAKRHIDPSTQAAYTLRLMTLLNRSTSYVARSATALLHAKQKS